MSSGALAASPRAAVTVSARLPVRVAYAALAWVVVFFAFHVYWYAGGSFGLNGELPSLVPDSLAGWIGEVLEGAAWLLGPWVCLAIARGWPRGRMRRAALIVVWLGCAVLVVRGGAGLIDDLTRAVGLLAQRDHRALTQANDGRGVLPVRVRPLVRQRHRRLLLRRRTSLRPAGPPLQPTSITD